VEAKQTELDRTFKRKKEMIETPHKTKEAKARDRAKKEKDTSRILGENRKKEKTKLR
jgi:hypothetical protein